jgi:thiosulfate reductase cytochrome b subunit
LRQPAFDDIIRPVPGHAAWVRVSHWIAAASVLALVFTGVEILMVHPRLYWGEAGNDLTPALIELPISRNHRHGGWTGNTPFFAAANSPISATRTFDIFNQNGWGRSLHFLAAWTLVIPGILYVINGLAAGHFRARVWPRGGELAPGRIWQDFTDHLRLRVRRATGGPDYGVLQKFAYTFVVFVAAPLMVLTGMTMSPAVTAAFPGLLGLFGGYQSARTIHFFTFLAIGAFAIAHVVMVVRSGFRRQMKGMTLGR